MTEIVTKKLLASHRGTGESIVGLLPRAVFQASVVNGSGISDTGLAAASASVLNDVATWIRNGPRYSTSPPASAA